MLLKAGYVLFHGRPTPKLLARQLKKDGCIGWCQCGEPAFVRWHSHAGPDRIACPNCTQEAVSHAAPHAEAAEDYEQFVKEGGKPS